MFVKEVTRDNWKCDFNILQLSLLIRIRLFLLREYFGTFRSHTFPFHSDFLLQCRFFCQYKQDFATFLRICPKMRASSFVHLEHFVLDFFSMTFKTLHTLISKLLRKFVHKLQIWYNVKHVRSVKCWFIWNKFTFLWYQNMVSNIQTRNF